MTEGQLFLFNRNIFGSPPEFNTGESVVSSTAVLEVIETQDTVLIRAEAVVRRSKVSRGKRYLYKPATITLAVQEISDRVEIKIKVVPLSKAVLAIQENSDGSSFLMESLRFPVLTLVAKESSDTIGFTSEGLSFPTVALTAKELSDAVEFAFCRDFEAERKRDLAYEEDEIRTLLLVA